MIQSGVHTIANIAHTKMEYSTIGVQEPLNGWLVSMIVAQVRKRWYLITAFQFMALAIDTSLVSIVEKSANDGI